MLCRGSAAPHLIDLGVRFLYMSYDPSVAERGRLWLDQVRESEVPPAD
jgi:hypothetical protein